MSEAVEPIPFEIRQLEPSDPDYEDSRAITRESQANLEYFLAHELELFERFPGQMVVVYDGGKRVCGCSDPEELHQLLMSLPEIQRAAALFHGQREPGTAWAL